MKTNIKKCTTCGLEKQHTEFPPRRRKCRECVAEYLKAWKAENHEKVREYKILKNFGVTYHKYEEMHKQQKGLCAICQKPELALMFGKEMKLAVDHDHNTGTVRGLLCCNCNRGIGLLKDNPEWLRRAAEYIEKDRPEGRP